MIFFILSCLLLVPLLLSPNTEDFSFPIPPPQNIMLTLDIMLVLDNTDSMFSHTDGIVTLLPGVVQDLMEKYPGTRVGVVTYNDENQNCAEAVKRKQRLPNYGARVDLP